MRIFNILKNPVKMIELMSSMEVAGKKYIETENKAQKEKAIIKVQEALDALEEELYLSGVNKDIIRMHSGVLYEMALRGNNIPPLIALETTIQELVDEGATTIERPEEDDKTMVENIIESLKEKE